MKRTIAIVAGGNSSEHDVSLHSAAGILSFMDTEKYDCYVVEMQGTDWHVDYNDTRLPIDRNDFSFTAPDGRHTFDFAYITIHGTPGENGILQGYFDLIGMPYSTSDVLVEALTFNKYALNNYLRRSRGATSTSPTPSLCAAAANAPRPTAWRAASATPALSSPTPAEAASASRR